MHGRVSDFERCLHRISLKKGDKPFFSKASKFFSKEPKSSTFDTMTCSSNARMPMAARRYWLVDFMEKYAEMGVFFIPRPFDYQ
jgi:hypothetical protein